METLTPLQVDELLDEGRAHQCDGFGRDKLCVKIASIGSQCALGHPGGDR